MKVPLYLLPKEQQCSRDVFQATPWHKSLVPLPFMWHLYIKLFMEQGNLLLCSLGFNGAISACVLRIRLLTIHQQPPPRCSAFLFFVRFSPEPNKGLVYQLRDKVSGEMTANVTQASWQTPVSQFQWIVLHQAEGKAFSSQHPDMFTDFSQKT